MTSVTQTNNVRLYKRLDDLQQHTVHSDVNNNKSPKFWRFHKYISTLDKYILTFDKYYTYFN